MNREIDVNVEPLPGYRLIERLGSGGYGEVWRAEAPGGLTKAIKFVFGKQHEKRATNELRALDHVRGVRHPFLLSLERIEIVDGRLLVVTELADGSVKDRFDACRRDSMSGIPRDELLGYLRDAADALDFMSQSYALQHLDIKPENLLLLSGHVKVADFGLVKDVRQSQASLVGGMTPLYAAPEVFRGTPSAHSDQYSLAIVFQEMLTGTLPFVGRSAAELTLQHLNDEPDLSAVLSSDRYAVSRALAKDPTHRFANCREFIETLVRAVTDGPINESHDPASGFTQTTQFSDVQARETVPTDMFDADEPVALNRAPEHVLVDCPPPNGQLTDLPPLDLSGTDPRPTPTLVLGIGGTGGRVLAHLRNKIQQQFGGAKVPSVQFLWLDTDNRALTETCRGDVSLSADDMLNLPLRRPQHYRDHSQQLLNWISRRWLYNIPRSLRTEGLRPLGRLALADHARQTGQRIRRGMTQAIDAASVSQSSAATRQQFREGALRVFVVASISGGTGGGMSLDLGYAVRAILEKLGLKHSQICGLMMHSTGRDARQSELARVNAFSWLKEFHHFQQSNVSYPGDASCGLPAHGEGTPAFDSTYFLHLGANLDGTEYDQAAQTVADYLLLGTLTSAGTFFDTCRTEQPEHSFATPRATSTGLRSFGIYRRTAATNEFCDGYASVITQQVLANWRGEERQSSQNTALRTSVQRKAAELVRRLKFDAPGLTGNGRALLELDLGGDASNMLKVWLEKQPGGPSMDDTAKIRAINRMFDGTEAEDVPRQEITLFGQPVATVIHPLTTKLQAEVGRWVTNHIDEPRERIASARQAVAWLGEHLKRTADELQGFRSTIINRIIEIRRVVAGDAALPGPPAASRPRSASSLALDYLNLRLDHAAIVAAEHALRTFVADAKAMSDEIVALGREVDQIISAIGHAINATRPDLHSSDAEGSARARLAANLQAHSSEIALAVDARLQSEYISGHGGLAKMLMQGGRPRAQLAAKLHEFARRAVQEASSGVNVLDRSLQGNGASGDANLRSALATATPVMLEFGGTRRVLAILPSEAARETTPNIFAQSLGAPATTISGIDNSLTLCVEAGDLSLPHIAVELVERRRDRIEFAERVHCRTDIAWTPLVPLTATPADSDPFTAAFVGQTSTQDAMCKTMVI